MQTRTVQILITISFLFITVFSVTKAQTLEELIQTGDQYYNEFNNEKALEIFKTANKLYPQNWEVLWRLSRTYTDIGEHMPTATDDQLDEQLATYELAAAYADSSVTLAPDQSAAYLRRAIAKGRMALFKGVFTGGIGLANDVRDDCLKAISLGNGGDFIQAICQYVYGRSHAKVSEKWAPARAVLGLGWADIDSAFMHYKKAIELDSSYTMIYVDYALALIEEDEYEEARKMLNKALECPIRDEDDKQRKAEAKALLEEIKDE